MNRPCIVGVAQHTWRPEEGDAPHPLDFAHQTALAAAVDCGNKDIIKYIDVLDCVLSISWSYDDLPGELAEKLQLPPGERKLSGLSGTHPQRFVNEACESIIQGKRKAVMICGAESFATRKRAKKQERTLDWPRAEKKAPPPFEDPFHPSELSHEVFQAYSTFAILDSARRAHLNTHLDEYRRKESAMMARLSRTAAENNLAWFQKEHSEESLFNMEDDDRMVAYPFTKNTMAFMDVDMSAALILCSDALADELGIDQKKRIYIQGWGYAKEPPYIAQRPELWRSPAMAQAFNQAMQSSNKTLDDIKYLDIYSCFAGNLNFTRDTLALKDDDARNLTVTGGLPYFGGPGNNYTCHSIASMVNILREDTRSCGLISAVGMHMTNHAFGVYGSAPNDQLTPPEPYVAQDNLKEIVEEYSGAATVAGYTVIHARHGNSALLVCDTKDGKRCYARCYDEKLLENMEQEEWVGKQVNLQSENKVNLLISIT